jgi:pimeloyl-ACP methyl ester carboxylesterase
MNEPAGTVKGARRCYIYSEEDDVIGWEDVEEHAREAQRNGWDVEFVKFRGSTHVGHFQKDPEKYRETIEKAWVGRSKL